MESVDREWSRFLAPATNGPMTLDAPSSRIDCSNLGSVREIDIQPALSVHGRRFGRARARGHRTEGFHRVRIKYQDSADASNEEAVSGRIVFRVIPATFAADPGGLRHAKLRLGTWLSRGNGARAHCDYDHEYSTRTTARQPTANGIFLGSHPRFPRYFRFNARASARDASILFRAA